MTFEATMTYEATQPRAAKPTKPKESGFFDLAPQRARGAGETCPDLEDVSHSFVFRLPVTVHERVAARVGCT